ncbi:MAG: lysozyme inhibitor LprI family protein [Bryobacteraceae bacterium]|jgi:uncharacterized protein YecT (DUF1311 family)
MAALRSVIILGCVFGVLSAGFGQQAPSRPKKVLTPEQEALQQQMKQVGAERESLRAKAKEAFEQEMAREKAGDCPDAHNTYQFNMCYQKALGATDQNLKTYEGAIRDLLSLQYPNLTGQPPMPGVAGPVLTPEQLAADFDRVEEAWHTYLDAACTAAFRQFGGGTGGPSADMECQLRLMRGHMRELDTIYYMRLHM